MRSFDVIVVGLGAMGSAAVYQLSASGTKVLGLDQYSPPHVHGSTHGDSRVTRLAIGEGEAYVPLVLRSHELWREIEAATGADVMTTTGALRLRAPGIDPLHHGKGSFMERTLAAAGKFGIRHEVMSVDDVRERFPQFNLVGDEAAYYEPDAGFIRPEAAVSAQLKLAIENGAVIKTDEAMIKYEVGSHGITVTTGKDTYSAGKLVLSLGPWVARHLPERLAGNFVVTRQTMHWFAITEPIDMLMPEHCPVIFWDTGHGYFYGPPAIDGPGGGMRMAGERFDQITDPDTVVTAVDEEESLEFYDQIIGNRIPKMQRNVLRAVSCLYTSLPDHDFVIDWLDNDVLLVSPCSGHGFKHSAAVGEVVSELVNEGKSTFDVQPFSLSRFS
jgi:sarcosine oxidase